MHVIFSSSLPNSHRPRRFGRRKACFDGVSSFCSQREIESSNSSTSSVSSKPTSVQRLNEDSSGKDLSEVIPFTTRRMLFASPFVYFVSNSSSLQAIALGNPSLTIEQVTPPVIPSGELFHAEERIVGLFEKNTYSVVNIFDVTLRPQLDMTGVVEVPEGNGSGVIWDEQGHIVTNYHVVGNALSRNPAPGQVVARVNILASDGVQKNFEGKLIGAVRDKDLGVLHVEAPKDLLRLIKVGQSSNLKVGQQCLAIRNPFGFDHTLTIGVISGGGPVLNSEGNLIGINTAIYTQTGTSAGVGFAIASSTVLKIVPQLIQFGKVVRAGLNVEIAPDLLANQLNVRNGALILQVPRNSPEAKAGLVSTSRGFAGNIVLGDIIVAVDDKPVRNKAELSKVLDDYSVGDKVLLKIQRGSENLEVSLVLGET
ncbi:hypothetical protein MKX01_040174 [Papaver californicum]|nr:hypothetical protein MKX01_040174 [Papaver californicum]